MICKTAIAIACLLLFVTGSAPATLLAEAAPGQPKQYVFFNTDRERVHEPAFLVAPALAGAQIKYTWRQLEPQRGHYDFSAIRADLAFLAANKKRLFVQLQDASFSPTIINVPRYLLQDRRFHGGADKQYTIDGDDEAHARPEGWVARRWDGAVRARFEKLLSALGREFDGKIEGINLPETAVDFGESGRLFPKGFTPAVYRDSIVSNMAALKRAFPKSVALQYANFMPGEWLPGSDHGYLRSIYRRAAELHVGVGGPDLLPFRPGQLHHSYPLIRASHGIVPTAIAVQEGNDEALDPKTGKPVVIEDLHKFATQYLQVNYIFWGAHEPFYSRKLMPFLKETHTIGETRPPARE
jgi:hypothetical protein